MSTFIDFAKWFFVLFLAAQEPGQSTLNMSLKDNVEVGLESTVSV